MFFFRNHINFAVKSINTFYIFQSILKVHTDDGEKCVPVTPETTCADVLECLRDPGEDNLCITEVKDNSGKLPCYAIEISR